MSKPKECEHCGHKTFIKKLYHLICGACHRLQMICRECGVKTKDSSHCPKCWAKKIGLTIDDHEELLKKLKDS